MFGKFIFVVNNSFLSQMTPVIDFFIDDLCEIVDLDEPIELSYKNINITLLAEMNADNSNRIIVFDKEKYEKVRDYIVSNFDISSDSIENGESLLKNMCNISSVSLYNIGRYSMDFEYLFPNLEIKSRINNLDNYNGNDLLIICDRKTETIINKINEKGLIYKKDYIWFEDMGIFINDFDFLYRVKPNGSFFTSNYDLLKNMIYTDPIDNIECEFPFSFMSIYAAGNVHICCDGWADSYIGNVLDSSLDTLWNSYAYKLRRLAIINKTYSFCNKKECPKLKVNSPKTYTRFEEVRHYDYPKKMSVCIDHSCNLYCPSCRTQRYNAIGEEKEFVNSIKDKILEAPWINDVELQVAGDGEVFYSEAYLDLIFRENNKKRSSILVLTNGTLFTKKYLDRLCELYNTVYISISMDGATKNTYEKLRRGGNFDYLMKNLEYISQKKKVDSSLKSVELNFVIQRDNYKEIPNFIELIKRLDFNYADFSRLRNWGALTSSEYEKMSMFYANDSTPKEELKEILNLIKKEDYKFVAPQSYLFKYIDDFK